MKNRIRRKLHSIRAFTLAEMLLAVLILLMVSAIVASGIPVAKNAYERVVLASNADVLLSTTISTLRNELGTARDITKQEAVPGEPMAANTIITYYNTARGAYSRIYVASGEKPVIMFQRYYNKDGLGVSEELNPDLKPVPLISEKTATGDLYVTYTSVTYDKDLGIVTFNGLAVNRTSGTLNLASRDYLRIRVISE